MEEPSKGGEQQDDGIKLKSCHFQPVFCRLQQEMAFQALEGGSTGKIGERVKEKGDKNDKAWGLQKGPATWRKELKSKRRSRCLVQARTVRQWKAGVTRAMWLRNELGRRSQQQRFMEESQHAPGEVSSITLPLRPGFIPLACSETS